MTFFAPLMDSMVREIRSSLHWHRTCMATSSGTSFSSIRRRVKSNSIWEADGKPTSISLKPIRTSISKNSTTLTRCGKAALDLLEADPHQHLEELDLLLDAHRLREVLVAVPQVDAAPDRGAGERPLRPFSAGQGDGGKGGVLGDRCGLHGMERLNLSGLLGDTRQFGRYGTAAKKEIRPTHDPSLRGVL